MELKKKLSSSDYRFPKVAANMEKSADKSNTNTLLPGESKGEPIVLLQIKNFPNEMIHYLICKLFRIKRLCRSYPKISNEGIQLL